MEETTKQSGFSRFGDYLRHHWLVIICLVITCTRTYDIFLATASLSIIAVAGVLVCEGSWFFWTDHVRHGKRMAQQVIATIGATVTWVTIGLTSIADVLWVASQRKILGVYVMPAWADLAAIGAVVAIALIHVALHFIYNWIDPAAQMDREHERLIRDAHHAGQRAAIDMDRAVLETKIKGLHDIMPKAAALFGQLQFNEQFFKQFGLHPGDINTKDLATLMKMLDKTSHGRLAGSNSVQTELLPIDAAAPGVEGRGGQINGEIGGGVDHRNFH